MAQDEGKQEEKFDFTREGEALGYISLDQARVLAMRTAGGSPGPYGRRLADTPMAFDVVEANETEDYYEVTLSFRPQGQFSGTPGQEQFFIEKEGTVAHRQVLSVPRPEGQRRIPITPVIAGLVVVIIAVVIGVVFAARDGGGKDDAPPEAAAVATNPILDSTSAPTPALIVVTATPDPTLVPTVGGTQLGGEPISCRTPADTIIRGEEFRSLLDALDAAGTVPKSIREIVSQVPGPDSGEWERACQLFDQGLALLAAGAPEPKPRSTGEAQPSGGTQPCGGPADMQSKRETWLSLTRARAGTLPDSVQKIIRQMQALPPGSWEEVCRLIDQGLSMLMADAIQTTRQAVGATPLPRPTGQSVFTKAGCAACHTIQGISGGTIGPELTKVATNAASRILSMSAEDYIRQSIEDPPAFLVEGFGPLMPPTIRDAMTDEEFENLVAFLLTQN